MRYWLYFRQPGQSDWIYLSFTTLEERDAKAEHLAEAGYEVRK